MPFVTVRAYEAAAKHRRQCQRHKARHQNRGYNRHGKFIEEPAENPTHEQHWNKDRCERQGHREDGEPNFICPHHCGLEYRSSRFDVADNIFEHDNRIVDYEPDGKRQCHQGKVVH